jgi:uncharacterized protein YyaL (SSP411 family)
MINPHEKSFGMAMKSTKTNRLASETSPYLLQHAHNPVDWYPWGNEAFEAARASNKPILLSVGYAACHWCHVMAHESFEDESTAELMNRHFINIKVDREERPDVDRIYMDALHLMGEQGGWPLTMFLDTERQPFWGGTYFPPVSQYGRPSFKQVLTQLATIWHDQQDKIGNNTKAILAQLQAKPPASTGHTITTDLLQTVARQLLQVYDHANGGIGSAPKFPQSPIFQLLWTLHNTLDLPSADEAVRHTMMMISQGGIYDHLAGGMARYTVDARWLVPHFEKMLYDNAQYVSLLSQLDNATHDDLFRLRIEETCDWLLSDMRTSDGLFASSYDADSEGEEGKYYCWQEHEIDELLPESSRHRFKQTYDVTASGNWEGKTILNRLQTPHLFDTETENQLKESRELLLARRKHRVPPSWDDKTLTDWNALTIQAFAHASVTLDRPDYLRVATETMTVLLQTMTRDGTLYHSQRDRDLRGHATADDLAHLIGANLTLYEATLDRLWMKQAEKLTHILLTNYCTEGSSSFAYVSKRTDDLPIRQVIWNDDVMPNANATMIINLCKLSLHSGNDGYLERAKAILAEFEPRMLANAFSCPTAWIAWIALTSQPQFVITGNKGHPAFKELHHAALKAALPYTAILHADNPSALAPDHPAYGKDSGDTPAVFKCVNQTCSLPVTDPGQLTP